MAEFFAVYNQSEVIEQSDRYGLRRKKPIKLTIKSKKLKQKRKCIEKRNTYNDEKQENQK
jgi:hypothetical protein